MWIGSAGVGGTLSLERAGVCRYRERDALGPRSSAANLRNHSAHFAAPGGSNGRVVQTFRELRGAGAEAEHEASARDRVQCRRGHRDGRGAAVPDARMPVPSVIRVVRAALASSTVMSYAHASGMKKPS